MRVLVATEVVAAEDAGEIGVEVTDAVREQSLVAEHRRDLAGQRLGVELGAGQLREDAVETLDDLTEQLPSDLPSAVGRAQDVDRVAVHPPAELRDLVARA